MQETARHHMAMDSSHGKDRRERCNSAYENSPRHLREEDPKQDGRISGETGKTPEI
jgi:hypothetical protein